MSKGRVIFYYESVGIGGAQLLLTRLAHNLYKAGMKVGYICSENGFLNAQLSNKGMEFININEVSDFSFSSEDLIVSPLSYIKKIMSLDIKNRDVRVFLWDVHPYNYVEYTIFSYFYKKKSKLSSVFKFLEAPLINKYSKNLEILQGSNSVGFMCKKNFIYNKDFFVSEIEKNYLPIFLDIPAPNVKISRLKNDTISIGWISRLDYDKVVLLNGFIRSLNRIDQFRDVMIKLIIIGSGAATQLVEKSSIAKIEFTGEMSKEKLDKFILENIDCGFSVGTAALEFAKLSIPTFLVPGNDAIGVFEKKVSKYLPLYKLVEYDVAVETYHEDITIDLKSCLELVLDQYQLLSKKSYDYVFSNHSADYTSTLIKKYYYSAQCSISELDEYYKEGFLTKMFYLVKKFGKRFFT